MHAEKIHDALEAWDAHGYLISSDPRLMRVREDLCQVVKSALLEIDGVDDVVFKHGSAGSIYFTCYSDASDTETIHMTVRVSNHAAGRRGCENAANFVVGDSVREFELQLAEAARVMAFEIEFALS